MVAAGDASRRRIERDLHDGVQQRLVSLQLDLRTAESMTVDRPAELVEQLAHIGKGLDDAFEDLGLIGLTDRVEAIGGRLTVRSPPGRGTTPIARLSVPRFSPD